MNLKSNFVKDVIPDSSLTRLLLAWYAEEKRDLPWRKTKDPYAIWISEVMLQQTQVKTVIPYFGRFLHRFPDVKQLAAASLEEVLTVWSGLGYYSRARRLWEGAHYICDQWGGEIPKAYESLLLVPGIGQYTAGAIASIAFGQRAAAIDGNVLRVLSRLLAWTDPVETVRTHRHFRNLLEKWQPALQPGEFNQAWMELGAIVCTPRNPDCGGCPLALGCQGHFQDDVHLYPVKRPKAQRQIVTRLIFVLQQGGRVYLQKRPPQGLLADLWEFPGTELSQNDEAKEGIPSISWDEGFELLQKALSKRTLDNRLRQELRQELALRGPVWHTFSHRRWKIIWTIVNVPEQYMFKSRPKIEDIRESDAEYGLETRRNCPPEVDDCWVTRQDLTEIALPAAFAGIVEDLV